MDTYPVKSGGVSIIIGTIIRHYVTVVSTFEIYVKICDEWPYPACFRSQISCG